jgi:alkylation response protein AidB-like acyl-CoA dehydrogenase
LEHKVNFEFTEEELLIQKAAKDFAEAELAPRADDLDRKKDFPRGLVKSMAELGLLGITVPEEYGGVGASFLGYILAVVEITKRSAAASMTFNLHNSLLAPPLLKFGSDEQKERYLKGAAEGSLLGAFALTEPEAGSDAGAQKTTAVKDGDDYVIRGTKTFITNGSVADFVILTAMTDPEAGTKGISAFIVDAGTPGFSAGKDEDKMGCASSPTSELVFDNCRVPKSALLGEEGGGFKVFLSTLDSGRIGVAGQAIGVGEGALEEAVSYAKEREQFGGPISRLQAIQWMIADMGVRLEASRLLTYHAAWLKDAGKPYTDASAKCKLYASEAATFIAHRALQIHGGYGYTKEYKVERYYRESRVMEIYEGTSEIQRLVVASNLLFPRKKKN